MSELDNIRVAVRVRPISSKEVSECNGRRCLQVNEDKTSIVLDSKPYPRTFNYDFVGDEDITQAELFETIGKPIVASCLSGYNATIFAYGQTGAGKSFSIVGPANIEVTQQSPDRGLLPRSLEFMFDCIKKEIKRSAGIEFLVKASFLEIYNEQINDLLSPDMKNLLVREDEKKGVYVEGSCEETVMGLQEAIEIFERGIRNRHVGATLMNKESSRSHSIFTITIESKEKQDNIWNYRCSRFNIIDLAGSERQKLTGAAGGRLKEAGMINKSLSTLGNVINSLVELAEGKSRHVHYRDSKLTFLLKDSLGGNSKTCIIANISPASSCFGETLSTLRFAERAKLVRNKAVVNEDTVGTVKELREEIRQLKDQLQNYKALKSANSGEGVSDYSLLTMNQRVKEVEELLAENMKIRLQSEAALQKEIESRDNYVQALMSTVEKYEKKIESNKMIIKFREDMINKLKQGKDSNESEKLKEENDILRKENENHPNAAKLFVENDALKQHIEALRSEYKLAPESLSKRLKDNQEFLEKLQANLRKSCDEREQLKMLLNNYSKYRNGELVSTPEREKQDELENEIKELHEQVSDLNKTLEEEKLKNQELESQLHFAYSKKRDDEIMESSDSECSTPSALCQKCSNKPSELQNIIHSLDSMSNELEEHRETISKLKSQLNFEKKQKEQSLQNFEKQSKDVQKELEQKEAELQSHILEIENLTAENQYLNTQLQNLNEAYQEKDEVYINICSQYESARSSYVAHVDSLKQEIQDYKNYLQEKEKAIAQKDQEVQKTYEQLNYYSTQHENILQQIQDLEVNSLQKHLNQVEELKSEIYQKEKTIQQKNTEIERATFQLSNYNTQYQALSTQIETLQKELSQKNKQVSELSQKQSSREELQNLHEKCSFFQKEAAKANEEIQKTIKNREEMLTQLKRLQEQEYSLHKQQESLQEQLNSTEKDNLRLRRENEKLSKENAKLTGHNNPQQKIKLHARMKDENNQLKEQNYKLREENFKKTEAFNNLKKKYDTLAKSNGVRQLTDIEEYHYKQQIAELQSQISLKENKLKEELRGLYYEVPENADAVDFAVEVLNSYSSSQKLLQDKDKEIQRLTSQLSIKENEAFLMKQKSEITENRWALSPLNKGI